MLIRNVALILVFLSGRDAELPDVGRCKFMEYYCSALNCSTALVKELQRDPSGNCSDKYNQMVHCTVKTLKVCQGDVLSHSLLEEIVRQSFSEDSLCSNGALEIPTMSPMVEISPCSDSFSSDVKACVKHFQEKFAANKSDPALCMEQAKAKQCLNKLIASDCDFTPAIQEMFDLSLNDHNPFCADNRDPGATGKDHCENVQDPNKTFIDDKSAGFKSDSSPAILLCFVSFLFFVKF